MDEAVFADWALKICLTGLIIFLGFIVWNLGKESKAGKFGIAVLFLVLGLGVFGFVFKELLIKFLVLPKQVCRLSKCRLKS
ncbi:DUF2788 domain-containing protein [Neisseria gonorrhoeae]